MKVFGSASGKKSDTATQPSLTTSSSEQTETVPTNGHERDIRSTNDEEKEQSEQKKRKSAMEKEVKPKYRI